MKMKGFFLLVFSAMSLAAEVKMMVLAGSTRVESYNKKLVAEAAKLGQEMGASVTVVDLKEYPMPFYDADLEAESGMPEHAKRFRNLLIQQDVVFIATPEYNGSISAVLKNAIDWSSRTEEGGSSREAFKGKKFGLMSASLGPDGGSSALGHLRSILSRLGAEVVPSQVCYGSVFAVTPEKALAKTERMKAALSEAFEASKGQKI